MTRPGRPTLRALVVSLAAAVAGLSAFAAPDSTSPRPAAQLRLEKGVVIAEVACATRPDQGYALYLPTRYSHDQRWPIIYAFDPGARGALPVTLLQDVAERYGYIVAGSNNSQNGPRPPQLEAAQAMWNDTHARFAIDERRVYATGFSGGARVATLVALICKDCIAGVIAHGAGLPVGTPDEPDIRFGYFLAVGNLDFNYAEVVQLSERLDELGVANRVRRFDGQHQWAPEEVWAEAVAWMELRAMGEKRRPRDEAFIEEQVRNATRRTAELEKNGDLYAAYEDCRRLTRELEGLADTSPFARKVAELEKSKRVRRGRKDDQEAIATQRRLTQQFAADLALLEAPDERQQASFRLRRLVGDLQRRVERAKEAAEAIPVRRALAELDAVAYSRGETGLTESDLALATALFELAALISPESPIARVQLARAHARSGETEKALGALEEAVARGFRNLEWLETAADLDALRGHERFQKLIEAASSGG